MVTKRLYGKEREWSIGQIKTCRKKQHVKIDGKKEMSDLICGKAAVGGNYNSTRDNMEVIDDHFAGVSLDELQSLDYLKFPDNLCCYQSIYLSVSSILKRYMEEHHIEDVFYFDAEKDIIGSVTNMIFTCRLRGENQTLYIDIDAYNMKCHVYEMEN